MKNFLDYEREVMRRFQINYVVSIPSSEPKLLEAARQLAIEGYLLERETYPTYGLVYTRFAPGDMIDLKVLDF